MNKKIKKAAKSNLRPTDRHDVPLCRMDASTYTHQIAKSNNSLLGDRVLWVQESHAKGIDLWSIVRGSGMSVDKVYRILGIDVNADKKRYDELVARKENMLFARD